MKGKLFKFRILGSDGTPIVLLCGHDYQKFFGFEHTHIDNIKNYMLKTNFDITTRIHDLQSKNGNRTLGIKDAELPINDFLTSLREEEGEAHTSRQVRIRLGKTHLRDDEDNYILPPH